MKLKVANQHKEKVILLNSGGFDSTTLHFSLVNESPEYDITNIYFHYGARNDCEQIEKVKAQCNLLHTNLFEVTLPNFDWTQSEFYAPGFNSKQGQYLEYRNLVFLSYAASYAQSIGAKKIFMAVLADGEYSDTCSRFIRGMNNALKPGDIQIETPFSKMDKDKLLPVAVRNNVLPTDYFSCDTPVNGKPCGICPDCKCLEGIDKVLTLDSSIKAFLFSGMDFSNQRFKDFLAKESQEVKEVRALINNDCQLKCSHCFYGFGEMKRPALDKVSYFNVLRDFVLNHGITNIHFSGKEPLFDDTILWYAEKIYEEGLPCTFNVVTNGINVPKYATQLKEYGCNRIYLSVDDISVTSGVRSVKDVTARALFACNEAGIPVEVFIDLHEGNYDRLPIIINTILTEIEGGISVHSFYIRTITPVGHANDFQQLTKEQLNIAWSGLKVISKKFPTIQFSFNLGIDCSGNYLEGTELFKDILLCESIYSDIFHRNLSLYLKEYCNRYQSSYTLTPDGFILGCGSDLSVPDYDKISAGNVSDLSIEEILQNIKNAAYCMNDYLVGQKNNDCFCKFYQHLT